MNWNESAACRGAWRRIFARSPICIEILKEGKRYVPKYKKDGTRSKKDTVEYHCQVCDKWVKGSIKGKSNIAVDHIIPVIDEEGGFLDWNTFHTRLFCDKNNLQRICLPDHKVKTQAERIRRNIIKYNGAMDILEHSMKAGQLSKVYARALKKILSKYKTKTRPQVIRDRAVKLTALLLETNNV